MLFLTRLPVAYNDGKPVPAKELNAVKTKAWQTFGGFTMTGPSEGAWFDEKTETLHQEDSYSLEVVIGEDQIEAAREFVRWAGKRLLQKEMILIFRDDPVEFLDTRQ